MIAFEELRTEFQFLHTEYNLNDVFRQIVLYTWKILFQTDCRKESEESLFHPDDRHYNFFPDQEK